MKSHPRIQKPHGKSHIHLCGGDLRYNAFMHVTYLRYLAFMFAHNGSKRLGSGVVILVQHLASNEAVLGDTLIQTTHWEDGNTTHLYCWILVNFPNLTIQFPWGNSRSFFCLFFFGWFGMRKKTLNHKRKTLCACKSMGNVCIKWTLSYLQM